MFSDLDYCTLAGSQSGLGEEASRQTPPPAMTTFYAGTSPRVIRFDKKVSDYVTHPPTNEVDVLVLLR